MIKVDCDYRIREDIGFILEAEKTNYADLSAKTRISRTTFEEIKKTGKTASGVCEKFYSYIYEKGYRINSTKEDLLKEKTPNVLFHGSKNGLSEVTHRGARHNCDFGNGFYLGETYNQALSFVFANTNSSVYSFEYSLDGLKTKRFDCSLDWMLAICYYRGTIKEYLPNEKINSIVNAIEAADCIIAPIADNKMFYTMAQFADGEINADVAMHSLSASNLGLQYIFRTEAAISRLKPIERYYLCDPERADCRKRSNERGYEIDTIIKLAKREYKTGLYIEELLVR